MNPRFLLGALALLNLAAGASAAQKKRKTAEERFLQERIAEMKAEGFAVKQKAVGPSSDGGKLAAYVFRDAVNKVDRLRVWHMKALVARQVFIEIEAAFSLDLERVHEKGRFPDLYGDGTRTLAYRLKQADGSTLKLVRFEGSTPQVERAPLPNGWLEDADGDGKLEVITRSLPLGRNYTIECGGFTGMVRTAYRTAIYGLQDGKLVSVSSQHDSWFNDHIARLEGDLASMDPRASQQHGRFLGAALSLYFDHAEKGMPQQGWRRFNELFRPNDGDPPGTSDCIRQVKADLRRRLRLPDTWE